MLQVINLQIPKFQFFRYTCQHCFFSSNSVEKLSQHLNKDHEGVPSILCLKCAWPFESAQEAGDHMRAEHYQDLKHIFCKGENVSSI